MNPTQSQPRAASALGGRVEVIGPGCEAVAAKIEREAPRKLALPAAGEAAHTPLTKAATFSINDTPLGDWVHADVAERLEKLMNANAIARCDAQDRADKLAEQNAALLEALQECLTWTETYARVTGMTFSPRQVGPLAKSVGKSRAAIARATEGHP